MSLCNALVLCVGIIIISHTISNIGIDIDSDSGSGIDIGIVKSEGCLELPPNPIL